MCDLPPRFSMNLLYCYNCAHSTTTTVKIRILIVPLPHIKNSVCHCQIHLKYVFYRKYCICIVMMSSNTCSRSSVYDNLKENWQLESKYDRHFIQHTYRYSQFRSGWERLIKGSTNAFTLVYRNFLNTDQSPIICMIIANMKFTLTGEHFIVDGDIKEFTNFKMDSVGRSVLTILRHVGRIKEIRGGKLTRYACIEVY